MRNKRELFRHVAFRHLRDISSFIKLDVHEDAYRAIALNYIQELWLYNYITVNTRDLLTIWLYNI